MPGQVQKTKTNQETDDTIVPTPGVPAETKAKNDKLKEDLDALLDEIDEALTENEAALFVEGYRQMGGQ